METDVKINTARARVIPVFIVAFFATTGCSTFSENYFIEVQECRSDWSRPHSSFIKLDLSGKAFFTESRFEMGWYDKRAVDSIFSTLSKENVVPTESSSTVTTLSADSDSGLDCKVIDNGRTWRRTRIYGPNGRPIEDVSGKRLVLFASSNPNNIVNRISTLSNTLAVSEDFALLLRKGEFSELAGAELDLSQASKRHEALIYEVQTLLRGLETSPPTTNVATDGLISGLAPKAEQTGAAQ
jgi:hypothetical protein